MIKRASLEHVILGQLAPRAINREGHEASNEVLGHGHAEKTHLKEDLKAVLRSSVYAGGGYLASLAASPFLGLGNKMAAYLVKQAIEDARGALAGGLKGTGIGAVGGGVAGAGAGALHLAVQALKNGNTKPFKALVPMLLGGGSIGAGVGALTGGAIGAYQGSKKKEKGNGR